MGWGMVCRTVWSKVLEKQREGVLQGHWPFHTKCPEPESKLQSSSGALIAGTLALAVWGLPSPSWSLHARPWFFTNIPQPWFRFSLLPGPQSFPKLDTDLLRVPSLSSLLCGSCSRTLPFPVSPIPSGACFNVGVPLHTSFPFILNGVSWPNAPERTAYPRRGSCNVRTPMMISKVLSAPEKQSKLQLAIASQLSPEYLAPMCRPTPMHAHARNTCMALTYAYHTHEHIPCVHIYMLVHTIHTRCCVNFPREMWMHIFSQTGFQRQVRESSTRGLLSEPVSLL